MISLFIRLFAIMSITTIHLTSLVHGAPPQPAVNPNIYGGPSTWIPDSYRGSCAPEQYAPLRSDNQTTELVACLNTYRTENWDGNNCADFGWYKGGSWYKDPINCYDFCKICIQNSIQSGASAAKCEHWASPSSKCWMGYHSN